MLLGLKVNTDVKFSKSIIIQILFNSSVGHGKFDAFNFTFVTDDGSMILYLSLCVYLEILKLIWQ